MIYEEWMERKRVRYTESISKNTIEDSDKTIESNLEGTESESQIEEGNKEYANQLIEEAHSELINYKSFTEAAANAARRRLAEIDYENSDYDEKQRLNNLTRLNISSLDEIFEMAREKYYEGKYSDAIKKAKFTKEKIKIFISYTKEKLADCNIYLDEYQQSNRANEHQNSSNSSHQPEYGTRDVWVDCMECHGSGKCKYCNGTGKNWYGNEYSDCVVCHGNTNCQICYGTRGHYEKQTYQIR